MWQVFLNFLQRPIVGNSKEKNLEHTALDNHWLGNYSKFDIIVAVQDELEDEPVRFLNIWQSGSQVQLSFLVDVILLILDG